MSPATSDPQTIACTEFVAGLADAGLTTVFISPGSRNTPLTLAFARSAAIADISIRDERSAGFMALGFAKATGTPAAVLCTSGSAATHYFPAVVEADQSGTPMIVLTADRPVSLRGTYAPQTMDQTDLYGPHVKAWIDLDVGHAAVRRTAVASVRTATEGIPGVVHINVPLTDPLVPAVIPAEPIREPVDAYGSNSSPEDVDLSHLVGKRVVIVAGGSFGPQYTEALGTFAAAMGAPLLADPQCRPASDATIANGDLLVSAGVLDRLAPDHIIRMGPLPTSKPTWTWLEESGIAQTLIQRSRLADPLDSAEATIDLDPVAVMTSVSVPSADRSYLDAWLELDTATTGVIDGALEADELTEPSIARAVASEAAAGSILFVGSSMPIRDVDTFAAPRSDVRIIGNRGVNGIDGSISTAVGMALAGVPTTALIGDVAALHDVTALAEAARLGADLRVVVINNDGGAIFSFLPQKTSGSVDHETYEHHWGTPHGLLLTDIARALGLNALAVQSVEGLTTALAAPSPILIEAHTDRSDNAMHHLAILDRVRHLVDRAV